MMLLGWLLLWFQPQTPSLPKISFQSVPDWVQLEPFDPLAEPATGKQYGGVANLLIEYQDHAELGNRFIRKAYRIQTTAGLQNGAQVRFDFDPLTQGLVIHRLVLHRDGKTLPAVAKEDWKLIQQETELDRFMYNGRFSAVAFLEGLQVGDTVEYAATIVRKRSLFGEKYWAKFVTSYAASLNTFHLRIVAPPAMILNFQSTGAALQPQIEIQNGVKTYTWLSGTGGKAPVKIWDAGNKPEPDFLTVTAYGEWFEVQSQLAPHYEITTDTPWLEDWLAELKTRYTRREDQVLEAIRFVQDDIRYLGIEMGASSHIPSPPEETFRRRFGDCKDKTQLLCTMLRKLGIQADAVLVDTDDGETLDTLLPSPFVFNHVVTIFEWEGARIGIDATVSHERGPLSEREGLPFGRGLVLNSRDRDLIDLPRQAGKSLIEIQCEVNIPDWGDTAQIYVRKTYQGRFANEKRAWFGENSRQLTSEALMARFKNQFPGIEAAKSLRVEDLSQRNALVVEEHYQVPGFGTSQEQQEYFVVGSQMMLEFLGWPSGQDPRWAPPHPLELTLQYKIRLPERWPFETKKNRIQNDVFDYEFSGIQQGRAYEFNWRFQSRKGQAKGVSEARYLEDLELLLSTINPVLSSWVTPGQSALETFWKPALFRFDTLASAVIFGGAWLLLVRVRRAYRKREWSHWQDGKAGGS